ncbi:MAG: replicative DNA helicase [Oscillospiraceae bacterium]|jgi:replicative DNA helicase
MDELLMKKMPCSIEAEQAVLGSILIDPRCVSEVVELLRAEDFYFEQNAEIYGVIYKMFSLSQKIDPVTVLDQMRVEGLYKEGVSREYFIELMEITPTAANVKEYAQIVRDKALLRAVAEAAGDISSMVFDGTGEADMILQAAEQRIYAIRKGRSAQGLEHISSVILDVFDRLGELAKSGRTVPGLTTGIPDLDRKISGLGKGNLIILASRPGMGKTSFALNIALEAAKKSDQTVVVFSLEMSREELAMRLLSNESQVELSKLNAGDIRDDEWEKITDAGTLLSALDIKIDDNPMLSAADMNAKCRREKNLGLVVVDYLQLMTSATGQNRSNDNRQQIVSDISRSLKIMAKELNVPVLCLSQLSRANENRSKKRPMLSDLRESGAIEQDADVVMFLYRESYYDTEDDQGAVSDPGEAECIVAKNRHGETGTVPLLWMPQFTVFEAREWKHDEKDGY